MTGKRILINLLKVAGGLVAVLLIGYFIFTTGQVSV